VIVSIELVLELEDCDEAHSGFVAAMANSPELPAQLAAVLKAAQGQVELLLASHIDSPSPSPTESTCIDLVHLSC
jgi:hypothetical protein